MRLGKILNKIKLLLTTFHSIQLFHILHELNGEADKEANKATFLCKGVLSIDGNKGYDNLP
jgi:hypothetical protein